MGINSYNKITMKNLHLTLIFTINLTINKDKI